jgi:hypothetical protein
MKSLVCHIIVLALPLSAVFTTACRPMPTAAGSAGAVTRSASVDSWQEALRIAEAYAATMRLPVPKTQTPVVKRFSVPENDVLHSGYESEYKERIRKALKGKVYWMVFYQAEHTQLGGDYAFFIDEKTGAVLAHYAGR